MTILEAAPAPYLKPLPEVRPENKPFFDALKNQQSPRMVAQRRGRSVAEILARREDQTAEA